MSQEIERELHRKHLVLKNVIRTFFKKQLTYFIFSGHNILYERF